VLATGDEIVGVDQEPAGAQIRNSNNVMVCALLRRLGCRAVDLGIIPDKPEAIRRGLLKAIHMDAAIVTGGMSMGQFDFVPELLRELGVELKITKLRIKPGKPFVFGVADRARAAHRLREKDPGEAAHEGHCPIFGLPGNPVSGFVCLTRLASRLLTRLAGGEVAERWLIGRLTAALPANGAREFYQPALVDFASGAVTPLQWKGSADIFTLAMANALIARPENDGAQPEGAMVRVMEI
jgi:molybdopterin molybdotransferase